MNKELYVVYFESANYCGYGEYCLVWATDPDDARDAASEWAEDFYREQDEEQFLDENGDCEYPDLWATITKDPYPLASEDAEDIRRYLLDSSQAQFYPIINEK